MFRCYLGLVPWYSLLSHYLLCWYSIWAPADLLLVQLPTHVSRKAAKDGSSFWATTSICKTQKKLHVPYFRLAQLQMLQLWGGNQWIGFPLSPLSLLLCKSPFETKINIFKGYSF